jgi:hypothetical protein
MIREKNFNMNLIKARFDQKKAGEARDIELAKSLKDQISS